MLIQFIARKQDISIFAYCDTRAKNCIKTNVNLCDGAPTVGTDGIKIHEKYIDFKIQDIYMCFTWKNTWEQPQGKYMAILLLANCDNIAVNFVSRGGISIDFVLCTIK